MELVDVPTDVNAETEVVEPENAQADADFAAGFDGKTEEPTGIASPAADAIVDPDAVATEEPVAAATKPAVKLTDLDEAQIQRILGAADSVDKVTAALEKLSGTAFGKIGGIERTLKQLQESTPAGQAITVSAEDLEEMKADFPELAEQTAKGLNRVLSKLKGTGGAAVDSAQIAEIVNQQVEERVQGIERKTAMRVADLSIPNWQEIVGPPGSNTEWRQWLATQPADYQRKINDTWEPHELNGAIQKFNQAKQAKPKPQPPSNRRERIEEGVTPRGVGGHATGTSDQDEFEAGFAHK